MEAPVRYRRHGQPDDMRQVMDAAAVLGVREFELFRLAWRRWWGGEPDEKTLERPFVDYMFQQIAPPWVRHFCREVLAREKEGRLDPVDFGVDQAARRAPPVRYGKVYVAATLAVMLVLYPALLRITYEPQTPAPLACEMGPGMQFFAGLAHEAALKFKETARIHAEGFSAAELMHGPLALVREKFPVLVFSQADETREPVQQLIDTLRQKWAQVFAAEDGAPARFRLPVVSGMHPVTAPIAMVQSFYGLAKKVALARGFNPDHPPHVTKVAETRE